MLLLNDQGSLTFQGSQRQSVFSRLSFANDVSRAIVHLPVKEGKTTTKNKVCVLEAGLGRGGRGEKFPTLFLGPVFGRTEFLRIFFFGPPPGFFRGFFSPDFFSSFLWGKQCPG